MTNFPVMTLLAERIPITLLCDLASRADPDSATINRVERLGRDPIRQEVAESATVAAHTGAVHPPRAASA
jgi:hypothetical protein